MNLSDVAKTIWYQNNLEVLLRSGDKTDRRAKVIMGLLATSKFKEAAEEAEKLLLNSGPDGDFVRAGTLTAWLADACSFAATVHAATKAKA
jgi:hypothetical protein